VTVDELARVRERVEQTCAAQGIDLVVSPDVAAQVALMVAAGGRPLEEVATSTSVA
jgi:hypothetical protein